MATEHAPASRLPQSDAPAEVAGYGELLESLKNRIRVAQVRAAQAVNRELISLYWDIGREIAVRQEREGWGASVIERLGRDLRAAFPDVSGFSARNLWRMRAFYLAYAPRPANLPQAVAEMGIVEVPKAATDAPPANLPQAVAEMGIVEVPKAATDAPPAILPQAVAEMGIVEVPEVAADAPPAILPQAVAELGIVEVSRAVADALPVILPQAVAEKGIVEVPEVATDAPRAILPQAVAELGIVEVSRVVADATPAILPQIVAEIRAADLPRVVMETHTIILPQPVAEIRIVGVPRAVAEAHPANLPQGVAESGSAIPPHGAAEAPPAILPQAVAEIPWGQNIVLLEKVKDPGERLWYARKTLEHGWSRNVLVHQIESGLYHRQGRAVTNFAVTLPAAHSDLAVELLKDPYHFDFLALGPAFEERGLERALLAHLRDFLLELGVGFALVGSQYRLAVAGQDFFIDLLFYHLGLRCFVAVELKVGAFQPEYAGKMSFYLAAVDDLLRKEGDRPSIGLILCKERDRVLAEYALRGSSKPIGVAGYRLTGDLPGTLRGSLPSPEELEEELRAAAGRARALTSSTPAGR